MTTGTLEQTEELKEATVDISVNPYLFDLEEFHQNVTTAGPAMHGPTGPWGSDLVSFCSSSRRPTQPEVANR